jgi:hypothetical protein
MGICRGVIDKSFVLFMVWVHEVTEHLGSLFVDRAVWKGTFSVGN